MLAKILAGLGVAGFILGVFEAQTALEGSHRQIEAGILMIAGPLLALIGLVFMRRSNKKCPHCAERVKREAKVCKHCGANLEAAQ